MILEGLAGLLVLSLGLFSMYILVPRDRINDIYRFGLVGGLVVALALIYIMQNILGVWVFYRADFFSIAGIPIFMSIAWVPMVIVFSHLMSQAKNLLQAALIIIAFPSGATILKWLLLINGMLAYFNWNLTMTFFLSLAIHIALAGYLFATGRLDNLRKITRL